MVEGGKGKGRWCGRVGRACGVSVAGVEGGDGGGEVVVEEEEGGRRRRRRGEGGRVGKGRVRGEEGE